MSNIQLITNNRGERYKLMNNISGKWRAIGSCLGLTPNQLDGFQSDMGSQDQRFIAVMNRWMSDADGLPHARRYPCSWSGLHTLLVDSGESTHANEFRRFIKDH